MSRLHNRDHFYKFSSVETARIIISNKTLRWSSPLVFNDPFDTQTGLVASIDPGEFADAFYARNCEMVLADSLPDYFDPHNRLHIAWNFLREARERFSPDELKKVFREEADKLAATLPDHLEKLSKSVATEMVHAKILCVAEDVNNVVMWSHYAQEHRGVAFKLKCLDDIDHPLIAARKVTYSDQYVEAGTALQLAEHFTGVKKIDLNSLVWETVFMKHADWSYEREWRCYWPLIREPRDVPHVDERENARIFDSIYFGCRMPQSVIEEMTALCRDQLPNAHIFKARKSHTNFDLVFDLL